MMRSMRPMFHMRFGSPERVVPFSHALARDRGVFVTRQTPFVDAPCPDGIERRPIG